MRISPCGFVLGLCFLPLLASVPALGQSDLPRFAGGVYGSLGSEYLLDFSASTGAYLEAARYRFRPGVEIRSTVGSVEGPVVLVGPRVSHAFPEMDVYAAGLFGRSHISNAAGTQEISGVTSEVVVGLEKPLGPYIRWRVVEFSAEFFSGASGVQSEFISTGIVLHFH